jgi:hypothetical protein
MVDESVPEIRMQLNGMGGRKADSGSHGHQYAGKRPIRHPGGEKKPLHRASTSLPVFDQLAKQLADEMPRGRDRPSPLRGSEW